MPELAFFDNHNRQLQSSYGGGKNASGGGGFDQHNRQLDSSYGGENASAGSGGGFDHRNGQLDSSYGGGSASGGGGGGDVSPDSVIYSIQSSLSLFSYSASGSASVERCSSASDVLDHDSRVSDMSMHLSGGFRGSSSARGSDPDPNKNSTVRKKGGPHLIGKKVEKAQAIREYTDAETDGEHQTIYSARSSFSRTVKECQNRNPRSEILVRKFERRRPASLDLNNQAMNVTGSSPRLGVAMKSSVSATRSGMFPSPGTPNYHPRGIGVQKGWSSEHVPSHTNANRIQGSFTSRPYNHGRTLPSKWEDAERWIISPVAGDSPLKPTVQQSQRRAKSKSGPLGPHGSSCYPMYSPAVPSFEGGNVRSFVTESSLSTGVNVDNNLLFQYQDGGEGKENFSSLTDPCIARSVSIHGCSELLSQSLIRITQDDKIGGLTDAATNISRDVSRRDMATQMSPESSLYSSPRRRSSLSSSTLAMADLQHVYSSKSDTRDVQVDDRVNLIRWSKKNRARILGRGSDIRDDWKKEGLEVRSADREASEVTKSLSKIKREEAKITAWENLQKAKAEAAMRKLEMKLEKKRSSSMDRIMHKLRSAQKKAQEMRESVLSNQSSQVARSSHKAISLIKICHIRSLSGCFTCPAF